MRKLACFSFAFAAGVLPNLLGAPRWVCCVLLALFLLTAAVFGRWKGRQERAVAICAAGLCAGLLWSAAYNRLVIDRAEAMTGESCAFSLELSAYPEPTRYGCTAQGYVERDGTRARATVYLGTYDESWKPGDVLTGEGTLKSSADGENRWYGRSVGIPLQGLLFHEITAEPAERIPVRYWPALLSHRLRITAEALFPADVAGYVRALLTGDKSGLSYQQKSDLQVAGIYHALAVSGMHVSILMSVLALLTMRNRRLYPLVGIPVLVLYCLLIGGAPSVIRASVMQAFLMAAAFFRRESDAPTALGASLLLLTAINPWCLLNAALQLSFLATAGILAFQPRIHRLLMPRKLKRLRSLCYWAAGVVSTALSALVLTLPLLSWYFGTVSLLTALSNLLMLPAITAVFALGFLACGVGLFSLPAASVLAAPVTGLLRYVAWCARWIARVPFAAIYPDTAYLILWLCFAYGAVLWLLLRKKTAGRTWGRAFGWITVTLCISLLCAWQDGRSGSVSFTALDVGQGQCLLFQSGDSTAAVDCGGSYGDEAGETLARALLSGGQNRLHYLILTHYDLDHTGGVRQLLYRIRVDCLLMPDIDPDSEERQELEQLAAACGTAVRYVTEDLSMDFGAGTLQVFAPVSREGGNESSLSILGSFDGYDILVTGDMTMSAEERLLERHDLPDLELFVAGHHGSRYSTGADLLAALTPELVVISVGDNSYGHPDPAVLERIAAAGAEVLRTDQNGAITVRR